MTSPRDHPFEQSPLPGRDGWADAVRDRLFEQRTILLRGELDDLVASPGRG
jgi:hypothetical protein